MGKFKIMVFLIFGFLILNFTFSDKVLAEVTVKLNHEHIKIDFFYHGSTVSVKGTSDHGADLIIKVTSPEGHQVLRKKGKVAGLLWMNVGELKLEHTPNLYFLSSTRNIEDILSSEEMDKYVIGYRALNKHIEITPIKEEQEKNKWFDEFLKFKESLKLYSVSSGKISVTEKDGKQNYYVLFDWPYQATQGDYLVAVHEVKDKKVIDKAEATVLVEQVGIVKTLFDMAKNNGALYGTISIIVALVAGFSVGMIFRKGKGAH